MLVKEHFKIMIEGRTRTFTL